MLKAGRREWLGLLILASALAAGAATASACVPQPFITVHPLASGPAGGQVTIDGQMFANGSRIEIRWNGTDGPVLGTAQSGDFSVPVTIPAAPTGLYTVVALTRSQAGVQGEVARAEFQVTGAEATPAPAKGAARGSSGGTSFASVAAAVGLVAIGGMGGALLMGRRSKSRSDSPRTPAPVG